MVMVVGWIRLFIAILVHSYACCTGRMSLACGSSIKHGHGKVIYGSVSGGKLFVCNQISDCSGDRFIAIASLAYPPAVTYLS